MKNFLSLFHLGGWPEGSVKRPVAALAVDTPVIEVSGTGIARTVTMTCRTPGAAIHFTMDGSAPTGSSSVYTSSIVIIGYSVVQRIRAVALVPGRRPSAKASLTVSIPREVRSS